MGIFPIIPIVLNYSFPDEDFSGSEKSRGAWALMGEIGVGPYDLQFGFELARTGLFAGLYLDASAVTRNSPTESYRQMIINNQAGNPTFVPLLLDPQQNYSNMVEPAGP